MNAKGCKLVAVSLGAVIAAGCAGSAGPAVPRSLENDPATTQPSYWLDQPGDERAQVSAEEFQKLWSACEEVLRSAHFHIDRADFRSGTLSSAPMPSKQFFELWRSDGVRVADVAESSLAKTRRTIHFNFERDEAGRTWVVTPKVLVERFASVEPKLRGTLDYDPTYWYAVRRDAAMEEMLANRVRRQLGRSND